MHYLLSYLIWNLLLVSIAAPMLKGLCLARFLRERPALRHCLWLLLLLKMITPPVLVLPVLPFAEKAPTEIRFSQSDVGAASIRPHDAGNSDGSVRNDVPTEHWNFAGDPRLWEIGAGLLVVASFSVTLAIWFTAIHQLRKLRRMLVACLPASPRATRVLLHLVSQFRLTRVPKIVSIDAFCSPMLWVDWRQSRIFLPVALENSASDESVRHMLAHELAHFVRYDYIWNLIAFFIASLFWWNPVVWFVRREMLIAAETSCDALVIERLRESRRAYANSLLDAADYALANNSVAPAWVSQFGETHSLRRRIEMIANSRVQSAVSAWGRLGVVSLGLIVLTLIPARAQDDSLDTKTSSPIAVDALLSEDAPADATAKADRAAEESDEENTVEHGNRAQDNQPKLKNARLISWGGDDWSSRAYFFETKQAAASFAKIIAAFKIAEQIQVVVSDKDKVMFDGGQKVMTVRPNMADQMGLLSDKFVLLGGSRDQHARVEAVIVALGAE